MPAELRGGLNPRRQATLPIVAARGPRIDAGPALELLDEWIVAVNAGRKADALAAQRSLRKLGLSVCFLPPRRPGGSA
jgi:hypothetical protein